MWDPRYGEVAAQRLAEQQADAATEPGCWSRRARTSRVRRAVGRALVRWGERLAYSPVRSAGAAR